MQWFSVISWIINYFRNVKFLKGIYFGGIIMGELSKLPNIGKVVEGQLNEVGINTLLMS